MNEKQKRVIAFLGTGAVIGLIVGLCVAGTTAKAADQVVLFSVFGTTCGAALVWFSSLR